MGTDISTIEEVRDSNGLWCMVPATHPVYAQFPEDDFFPFGVRRYSVYGFLGGIRNTACSPVIAECRGLPRDSETLNAIVDGIWCDETRRTEILDDGNNYGYSWVTLAELLAFDYEQSFENLRVGRKLTNASGSVVSYNGNVQVKPGEGKVITLREHLGEHFFAEVEGLRAFGEPENVRVIFWFN